MGRHVLDINNTVKQDNRLVLLHSFGEEPRCMNSYVIASGIEDMQYDPFAWVLEASNDAEKWVKIDYRFSQIFPYRKREREYKFCNTRKYKYYKFCFEIKNSKVHIGALELIETNKFSEESMRKVETGDLLYAKFTCIMPYVNPVDPLYLSGWEMEAMGGVFRNSESGRFWIELNGKAEPLAMKKRFLTQRKGNIILEYRIQFTNEMEGATCQLRGAEKPLVDLHINNGCFCYRNINGESIRLQDCLPWQEYGIRVKLDLDLKEADIFIDGSLKAGGIGFCEATSFVDYFYLSTGNNTCGSLYINPIHVYKGYRIFEDFKSVGNSGSVPYGWVLEGRGERAGSFINRSSQDYDMYSLKLDNTDTGEKIIIKKEFDHLSDKIVLEYSFMLPKLFSSSSASLTGERSGIDLVIKEGALYLLIEDKEYDHISDIRKNVWYHVRLIADLKEQFLEIIVNRGVYSKKLTLSLDITFFKMLQFGITATEQGCIWLDDIKIYDYLEPPQDYVPEPIIADPSPYILGMQSCTLWREGGHYGWDWIRNYDKDRKPYLGWYEEGNAEVADWEIKWMLEHGISFNMFCWFRPIAGEGWPIKDTIHEAGINGYLDARYSDRLKFIIMVTNHDPFRFNTMEDFKDNLVPYLIEHFIRDLRYMTVDNKPLVGFFDPFNFHKDTGNAAEALKYLEEECKKLGYEGTINICCFNEADKERLRCIYEYGFDYVYSYTWGQPDIVVQKEAMLKQCKLLKGRGMVPTICCGWDRSAWNGGSKEEGFVNLPDWENLALWAKDSFMSSLHKECLGRKLLMLGNWNEYGEGHFMMPSSLNGFGYLDVLRKIFTQNKAHEDIVPTSRQKARLDALYPNGW